jgi:hypothetical protein
VTYLCFTNVTYVVDFSVVLTLRGINLTGIIRNYPKSIFQIEKGAYKIRKGQPKRRGKKRVKNGLPSTLDQKSDLSRKWR